VWVDADSAMELALTSWIEFAALCGELDPTGQSELHG